MVVMARPLTHCSPPLWKGGGSDVSYLWLQSVGTVWAHTNIVILQGLLDIHFKLHIITPVATKVHVILRSFVVLTWMRDTIELV